LDSDSQASKVDLIFLVHRDSPSAIAGSCSALAESVGPGWNGKAILVENAPPSRISSLARAAIRESFPSATRIALSSRRNLGFGRAINLGIAKAEAPFVGVFAIDGAVEPDTVALLVATLEREPDALSAAATMPPLSHNPDDAETPAADAVAVPVNYQPGGATLYRRDAFLELGGFDPMFFMYSEDSELSQRARRAGWKLVRVRPATFHHDHGDWGAWKRFNRLRLQVLSSTSWSYQYAPSRIALLRALARKRGRWFAYLARQSRFAQLAGAVLGTAWWPTRIPRIEHRRRHPWDRESLETWLAERLPTLDVSSF
jgi:N-acetylglucosaminyl-diphospho-decaprenol L-rhamnosyltransferase